MELITVNNKTEYITSFNSAMELVENKCGLELARCIQDMHQQALEELQEYIKHAKRLDRCKMLKYLEKTLDISSDY